MTPALLVAAIVAAAPPIATDGSFDEWRSIPIVLTDPADAPVAELDLGEIRLTSDDRTVYGFVDLRRTVNPQRLDGRLMILLDSDGDPETGRMRYGLPGVDAIVMFTPPNPDDSRRSGMGIGVSVLAPTGEIAVSPYAVGMSFAPTFANNQIEFALARTADVEGAAFLTGDQFSGRLLLLDDDDAEADVTETFSMSLPPLATTPLTPIASASDPMSRGTGEMRVVSWNTRFGALLEEADAAARVLKALEPDVLLLQEMTEDVTAEDIEGLLTRAVPPGDGQSAWRVEFGPFGGPLRSAVASRLAMEPVPSLTRIPMQDRPDRVVRSAVAVVRYGDQRVLVASTHLKCCGRLGDRSDKTRDVETKTLRDAVRIAHEQDQFDAIIIGGDMNLVGGRGPLDTLRSGIDVDGSSLAVTNPMQFDGRSNATWSDVDQPFVPGRLDYVLFSDASLAYRRGFVLDSRDLAPQWLTTRGLEAGDTGRVSDHFPVVVDLGPR